MVVVGFICQMDRRKVKSREAEVKLANWIHVGKGHDLKEAKQDCIHVPTLGLVVAAGVEHDLQLCGDTRKECCD